MPQTYGFQAEVQQLLKLMIHSLYSNKEIFLRELVSNASDACDKLRFESIANPALLEGGAELEVKIDYDKARRVISITDTGVGLSREEAISHLGTIAKSGTKEFFENLSGDQARDSQLIGQFGVGFYSSYIVADKVTVTSRRAGLKAEEGVRWESEGTGEFTVETVERAARGTTIELHLREGEDELLSGWKLKQILTKYSDHIGLPIRMPKETWDNEKSEQVRTDEWETVNKASALWTRSKNDISEDDYKSFYKHVSHDFQDPLAWTHNRVEGRSEYTQLLYVPKKAPFDIWDRQAKHGLKLYVRRVFIMDDAEQLLPVYLRFVRGIVDSADLPLNVSREILQESRDVKTIREGCTKRILGLLEDLAENHKDDYTTFWTEFGSVLKEGMGEDLGNKARIAKLLRFASTHEGSQGQDVALADYVSRMKPGQKAIYYVTADSVAAAKASPHLEVFRKKGVEVLLLTDRVDEWMLSFLNSFDVEADEPKSYELMSVARGSLDLGDLSDEEDRKKHEAVSADWKEVVEKVKTILGERIKEVRMSDRLTESASCLVSDEHEISGHLERLLKQAGQAAPERKGILELNPDHALVARLRSACSGESNTADDFAFLLLDQAILTEGGQLEDPAAFVKRVNRLVAG